MILVLLRDYIIRCWSHNSDSIRTKLGLSNDLDDYDYVRPSVGAVEADADPFTSDAASVIYVAAYLYL